MTKVYTFKVAIDGLEDKIWRKIEITDKKTAADLAYTILATFDSLAYHLYYIKYKDNVYDSWVYHEYDNRQVPKMNATTTTLNSIHLQPNDTMEMEYDFGSPTVFKITFLESRDLEKGRGRRYPYIIDGAGRGMIDDVSGDNLKTIVDDIDKKGFSDHDYTPGYERTMKYDYRKFDIKRGNILLKGNVSDIKNGYELITETTSIGK